MNFNPVNTRAFQEGGSVGSNIIRKVEVWGVDYNFSDQNVQNMPMSFCRDSTGYLYQVLLLSGMGTSQPQVGETWLISRALGLWTYMARVALPSPIVQFVVADYNMVPSNRVVLANVPSQSTINIKLPNPITGIQGEVYAVRNSNPGGSGYSGNLGLLPFNTELIRGPITFGATSGASFVTDNKNWFCVGETKD